MSALHEEELESTRILHEEELESTRILHEEELESKRILHEEELENKRIVHEEELESKRIVHAEKLESKRIYIEERKGSNVAKSQISSNLPRDTAARCSSLGASSSFVLRRRKTINAVAFTLMMGDITL
jgi:hypothetical protein